MNHTNATIKPSNHPLNFVGRNMDQKLPTSLFGGTEVEKN
jgi:hypothetical protein